MASAAPVLASMLASKVVGHIGESQGWDPRFTAIASTVAGAAGGSVGAGFGAASGASVGATNAFNPATTGVMAGRLMPTSGITSSLVATMPMTAPVAPTPHISSGFAGGSRFGGTGIWQPGTSVPADEFMNTMPSYVEKLSGIGLTSADPTGTLTYNPTRQERFMAGMKNQWKDTWNDKNFITSLGSTFIDGLFYKEPPPKHQGGGGGGGGGPTAPAYAGGGNQQFQMVPMYPQVSSPQWQEIQ